MCKYLKKNSTKIIINWSYLLLLIFSTHLFPSRFSKKKENFISFVYILHIPTQIHKMTRSFRPCPSMIELCAIYHFMYTRYYERRHNRETSEFSHSLVFLSLFLSLCMQFFKFFFLHLQYINWINTNNIYIINGRNSVRMFILLITCVCDLKIRKIWYLSLHATEYCASKILSHTI